MRMTTRDSLRRTAAAAAAFVSLVAPLTACDPPPADEMVLGPKEVVAFAVERMSPSRGTVAADGPIVLRFTQDVDPASVGSRSVRVTRANGRRPVRVRAWAAGRELRVAPQPGHAFPADGPLLLHLDGSPSPRAVRAASGEPLARAFESEFRPGAPRADLTGPSLVQSLPRTGADDVTPGSSVELSFSEPVARGSVASGDAVTLRVDDVVTPARLALSGDGAMIVVHPQSPLPPGHRVEVELHTCLLDLAGNPLDPASVRTVAFRTRATSLHELSEDFVDSAKSDARATSCGWDDPETPGVLVARSGTLLVAPDAGEPRLDLGDTASVHFQLLVPAADVPSGLASALRVEFAAAPEGAQVLDATIEAGPTSLDDREPSFVANRAASQLRTVARVSDPVDVDPPASAGGRASVDIVFEEPLRLDAGRSVMLDVRLEFTHGLRVAAFADPGLAALVEGASGVAPAAALLVSPSAPQARSLWYDTGVAYPGWQLCRIVRADEDAGVAVVAEFQAAPPAREGGPDVSRASPWEKDLTRLPAYRFVRFRLRFDGTPESGAAPRIDRIVLPYER
jgi:hypothetical protein